MRRNPRLEATAGSSICRSNFLRICVVRLLEAIPLWQVSLCAAAVSPKSKNVLKLGLSAVAGKWFSPRHNMRNFEFKGF